MKRREFITLLGGAAGWPFTAQAQRQEAAVIGLLNAQSGGGASKSQTAELRRGLEDGGFVEGQTLQIEYRSDAYHIRDLAADLVKRQVAVIICIGDAEAVEAAQESTSTIPIVFATESPFDFDPYDLVVKAVNWPNANATGYIWSPSFAFANKRFELLNKLAPNAKSIGYLDNLVNSGSRNVYGRDTIDTESNVIRRALGSATGAGRKLLVFEEAFTERRIDLAFEDMAREGVEMLVVSPDAPTCQSPGPSKAYTTCVVAVSGFNPSGKYGTGI